MSKKHEGGFRKALFFFDPENRVTQAQNARGRNAIDKIPDLGFTDRDEKNQHGRRICFPAVE